MRPHVCRLPRGTSADNRVQIFLPAVWAVATKGFRSGWHPTRIGEVARIWAPRGCGGSEYFGLREDGLNVDQASSQEGKLLTLEQVACGSGYPLSARLW